MNDKNYGNEFVNKIAIKIEPFLTKIEYSLLLIFIVGLGLSKMNFEISGIIITISLSLFANLYFILGFKDETETKTALNRFLTKLIFWSFSTAIVGILFAIQLWPGGDIMVTVSLFTILASVFGLLIDKLKNRKEEKIIEPNFIRAFIIILVFAGVYLNGNIEELKKMQYESNKMYEKHAEQ